MCHYYVISGLKKKEQTKRGEVNSKIAIKCMDVLLSSPPFLLSCTFADNINQQYIISSLPSDSHIIL